jgi:hypothetical protein
LEVAAAGSAGKFCHHESVEAGWGIRDAAEKREVVGGEQLSGPVSVGRWRSPLVKTDGAAVREH